MQKKIADHERAAGGSLEELQVGGLVWQGRAGGSRRCAGASNMSQLLLVRRSRLPQPSKASNAGCVLKLHTARRRPILSPPTRRPHPRSVPVAYEASAARMSRDGRRCREAIETFAVMDDALKLRSRKLQEVRRRG